MNEKYPISKNKFQCRGPCYYPGTSITHPQTLSQITYKEPFCPIDQQIIDDEIIYLDKCEPPTNDKMTHFEYIENQMLNPIFEFSPQYFTKIIYKILSLEDFLTWLDENKSLPFRSKERVFNNGVYVFYNDISVIDARLVDFIMEILSENIVIIYRSLEKYIEIKNKNITLAKNQINRSNSDKKVFKIKMNYLKKKLLTKENIENFLAKFIKFYKDKMKNINLSNHIVFLVTEYIKKKINSTVS